MRFQAGKAHPRWNGGKTVSSHGYILIRMPDHPRALKNGYVYKHILVAETKLCRYLKPNEIVHHIDKNKKNNSPENIMVVKSIAEHKIHHRNIKTNLRMPEEDNPMIECECGCKTFFLKYDKTGRPRKYVRGGHWRRNRRIELCH